MMHINVCRDAGTINVLDKIQYFDNVLSTLEEMRCFKSMLIVDKINSKQEIHKQYENEALTVRLIERIKLLRV